MCRSLLIFSFLCLLTTGFLVVAQETTSIMSPNVNSSESAANMSITDTPTTVWSSPSSSAPSIILSSSYSSSISQTSSSPLLSSSTSASPSPTTLSAASTIITSQAPATATTPKPRELNDTTYIPMVAAIVGGFGLLFLLLLLFLSMALVYRYLGKEDSTMLSMKKPKKGADAFYTGIEPQSAQYLVSSMSINSFGSSPSDARLDSHLPNSPGVHYNRGFDIDHNPSGAGAVGNGHEEGFKPIQIVAADVNPKPNSTHV